MAVIPGTFVGIAQNCVRIGNFFETLGRFVQVVRIFVWQTSSLVQLKHDHFLQESRMTKPQYKRTWVPFQCQFPICHFNVVCVGISRNAQNIVQATTFRACRHFSCEFDSNEYVRWRVITARRKSADLHLTIQTQYIYI